MSNMIYMYALFLSLPTIYASPKQDLLDAENDLRKKENVLEELKRIVTYALESGVAEDDHLMVQAKNNVKEALHEVETARDKVALLKKKKAWRFFFSRRRLSSSKTYMNDLFDRM